MTPRKFIVAGLPRSRTAWLSVLLSHGRSRCVHELSVLDPDLASLGLYPAELFDAVGTADPSVVFMEPDYAQYATVVIKRDLKHVLAAMAEAYKRPEKAFEPAVFMAANALAVIPDTLKINYTDLDRYEVCDRIWRFIGNPDALSRDWFDRLRRLRIEIADLSQQEPTDAAKARIKAWITSRAGS